MTNPLELERLIQSAAQQQGSEPLVNIILDGTQQQVPASVGTYFAVTSLSRILQQIELRLEALHAHASGGAHPKSKGAMKCPQCRLENMTPDEIAELNMAIQEAQQEQQEGQKDAQVVAGNVGTSVGVQGTEEEEQVQV